MKSVFEKINFEDVSQIIVGAAVMAIPIAFSEELWKFGETLPLLNILMLATLSLTIQTFYTSYKFLCKVLNLQVINYFKDIAISHLNFIIPVEKVNLYFNRLRSIYHF